MDPVLPSDLSTYLGDPSSFNDARAQMLIDDATNEALSVVSGGKVPDTASVDDLPDQADAIVRAAAARLYVNPAGVTQEVTGSFSVSRPAASASMLSRKEKAKLKRLAGNGAAFTVDLTPTDALDDYESPLAHPTEAEAEAWALSNPLDNL
jgi:hypothetical protein